MGISVWQLLIILLIVMMLFGTKRIKNIGSDLGGAIRGFRKAIDSDDDTTSTSSPQAKTYEAETQAPQQPSKH